MSARPVLAGFFASIVPGELVAHGILRGIRPPGPAQAGSERALAEVDPAISPGPSGLLILLGFIFDSSYTVEPHEQAVVLRFGKYHATTTPGLHFKLPMIDQVMKVSVEEHGLRLPFGATSHAGENARPDTQRPPGRRDPDAHRRPEHRLGRVDRASGGSPSRRSTSSASPATSRTTSPPTSSPSSPAP